MDKLIPPFETHGLGMSWGSLMFRNPETPISCHILIDLPPPPPHSTLCRSLVQAKHLSPASYGRAAALQQ